jgi:hypothetical protein
MRPGRPSLRERSAVETCRGFLERTLLHRGTWGTRAIRCRTWSRIGALLVLNWRAGGLAMLARTVRKGALAVNEGLFTLAGALLGGALSIFATHFQDRSQHRREARAHVREVAAKLLVDCERMWDATTLLAISSGQVLIEERLIKTRDEPPIEEQLRAYAEERGRTWLSAKEDLSLLRIAEPRLAGVAWTLVEASYWWGSNSTRTADDVREAGAKRTEAQRHFEEAVRDVLGLR